MALNLTRSMLQADEAAEINDEYVVPLVNQAAIC